MDTAARSALMERLTCADPSAINAALQSTEDLHALREANEHWTEQSNHARRIAFAISARMDVIRGS